VSEQYVPNEREERMEKLLREGLAICVLATNERVYSRAEVQDWLQRASQFLGPSPDNEPLSRTLSDLRDLGKADRE